MSPEQNETNALSALTVSIRKNNRETWRQKLEIAGIQGRRLHKPACFAKTTELANKP